MILTLILLNLLYIIICLYIQNSLFHISTLFLVAILQIPTIKIFSSNENRYEGACQEITYNIKSKKVI